MAVYYRDVTFHNMITWKSNRFVLSGMESMFAVADSLLPYFNSADRIIASSSKQLPQEKLTAVKKERNNLMSDLLNKVPPPNETEHAISKALCSETIKKARASIEDELKLTEAAIDAKKAMEFAVAVWQKDAVEFMNNSDSYLKAFRQTRMALESEAKHCKGAMSDILSVLGAPEFQSHLTAVNSLITAAEKLKALKDSGFLDAVVDTLLKADELARNTPKQSS